MPLPQPAFVVGDSLLDNPHLLDGLHDDERLTQAAIGLLPAALSFPAGTRLTAGLLHHHRDFSSLAAIEGVLDELFALGYLRLTAIGDAIGGEVLTLYASPAEVEAEEPVVES